MRAGASLAVLERAAGFLRSLAIYHAQPGRQRRALEFFRRFLGPGDLCFDVGAHLGSRSLTFRRLGARVVAVEPQEDCARFLAWLFRRDSGLTLERLALGSAEGWAQLYVSPRTPTVTTLAADWIAEVSRVRSFAGVHWRQGEKVRVSTLDDLISRYGLPRFVKLDVEGFEAEVLAGLSHPVPALSFEYLPAAPGRAAASIARLSELAPYRFSAAEGERLRFVSGEWVSAPEILDWLARRPPESSSGDIYALAEVS